MLGNSSEPFGTLLKQLRKRRRLTQQQLAETLGVHRNTIGRWEEGSFLPESKALVLDLARHLHLDEQETRHLLDASLIVPASLWSVPYPRNPFFTGREDILATLHARLGPGQSVALTQSYALHGLGGIGKPQLALEYAYRYALEYRAIFWIRAETVEQVHTSLLQIAERLDVPERMDTNQQRVVAAVRRWLETHGEWLLIWDNLEDLEVLQHYLPASRQGAVLITTRRQALGTRADLIEIPPLGDEDAMLLLLRRARRWHGPVLPTAISQQKELDSFAREDALTLVHLLDGLPLALDQAGAYLEETGCRLGDYLRRYQAYRPQILARRGADGGAHPASVATTLQLAVERVELHHPAAAEFLRLCAFLHAEAIPEELFRTGASYLGPILGPVLADAYQFDLLLAALRDASLITRYTEPHMLSVHRLVQAVLQDQMEPGSTRLWADRVIRMVNVAFPNPEFGAWAQCERLLTQALACVPLIKQTDTPVPEAGELVFKAGTYLTKRGRIREAEALLEQTLALGEQLYGPVHQELISPLMLQAELLWRQRKYTRAGCLLQRCLMIGEQTLQAEDPLIATILVSLATVYSDERKYALAEPLFQRALRIREQRLGPDDHLVASTLNDLAILYRDQRQYERAETFALRALQIWERQPLPERGIALPLNVLADLHWYQGRYEQAEPLYQRALGTLEQYWWPDHPATVETLTGLATLYRDQGKYEKAELLYQRALHIWERQQGPECPDAAIVLTHLATLYRYQNRHEQARLLYQRALHIWEPQLGAEHPFTATILAGLATVERDQENYAGAEPLYQRALLIQERQSGAEHPNTASTLYDLSILRQKQRNLCEAVSFAERALKICAQSLGENHPKTIAAREHRAQLLHEAEYAETNFFSNP